MQEILLGLRLVDSQVEDGGLPIEGGGQDGWWGWSHSHGLGLLAMSLVYS